jgi:hypothetical protein
MLPLIGAGIGLIGGIGKMFARGKANKEMRNLQQQDPNYTANPLAAQRLSYARSLRDARMPGAAAAERNIYGNMGNTLTNIQNNATNSGQVLAMAAAAQGQAQQGFENLGMAEAQDQQRRMGNWKGALEGQIQEEDKVFGDDLRQYGNKVQMQGAMAENRANTWGDISNMGFGIADFAQAGGFKGMEGMFSGNPKTPQPFTPMSYQQVQSGVDQAGLGRIRAMNHIRGLGNTIQAPKRRV